MLSSRDFDKLLERLVVVPVEGLGPADKLIHMRQILSAMEVRREADDSAALAPGLDIVPAQPGRRPLDEVLTPGYGASDRVLVLGAGPGGGEAWLLFHLRPEHAVGREGRELAVLMSAWSISTQGKLTPIPGCQALRVAPRRICRDAYPRAVLTSARWDEGSGPFVAEFSARALMGPAGPGEELLPEHAGLVGGSRRVRVELQLCIDGVPHGFDTVDIEVYEAGRLGSLYARLRDQLLDADVASQAGKGLRRAADHPLYPGLRILADAAAEELRSIVAGHELHRPAVSDPVWSLRVGAHLELLTFLGLSEAARPDHPSLLDARDGAAPDRAAALARLRAALDGDPWCDAWTQRVLACPDGEPGPAESELAIRRRQRATSSLFAAHLGALRVALTLAGPELDGTPELWHRRLRVLERAVLRNGRAFFPERTTSASGRRQRILWQASAHGAADGGGLLDGVFPSLCRELRRGLNDAAAWARSRGLFQYAGAECIPAGASLLEALLQGDDPLFAELQRRDGADPLEVDRPPAPAVRGRRTGT